MTEWSADELRQFLATIEDNEWYVPIFIAANTGMRRGEVLGLTWRNLDLDAARLVVSQQILSVQLRRNHRTNNTMNPRAPHPMQQTNPPATPFGQVRITESASLKAGVPVKVVSERLGHSSPAFTMTVYQHVLPGMQADAAAAFSAAVFGTAESAVTRR